MNLCPCDIKEREHGFVYYEAIKRELKRRPVYRLLPVYRLYLAIHRNEVVYYESIKRELKPF